MCACMATKTLFYGGYVVTENAQDEIYRTGWLLIEGDAIRAVGEGEPPTFSEEDIVRHDVTGSVIMPGIVNIHTHVGGTIFKGLTESVAGSLYRLAFPMERFITEQSMYPISMLGAIEAVKFGSTFLNDLYLYPQSTARAVSELGLRAIISHKIYEPDFCRLRDNDYTPVAGQGMQKLEENIALVEAFHKTANGRIECGFGPHATDTVSIPLAKKIRDCADRFGARLHTHVAQKNQEVAHDREVYGLTPVEYLLETGLAGPELVAAHCVCLTESDAALLGSHHIPVAHCPEVFFKGGGSFTPVRLWQENGVDYGLGTDWVSLNPWSNMRTYLGCWRTIGGYDEQEISARLAFRKATIDAARLIGKADQIGSLECGKKADFFIMNLQKPYLQPLHDLDILSTIIWNATGTEIETVYIDGVPVVKDGRVTTVDEESTMQEATEISRHYLARQLEALR